MRYAFMVGTASSFDKQRLVDFLSAEPGIVGAVPIDRMGPPRLTAFVEAATPSLAKTLLARAVNAAAVLLDVDVEVWGDAHLMTPGEADA